MTQPEKRKLDDVPTCGLVMPISAIDGCDEQHWAEVQAIIQEVVAKAGFQPRLVSEANEVGIIHQRIVQNLYEDPIVVCDVSAKNPNVMFELGLRLAFDRPTVIIKDDQTPYSFDTSPIEHLGYRRDLRHASVLEFKEKLFKKIRDTHESASKNDDYSPFLRHFGRLTPASISSDEVPISDFLLSALDSLSRQVSALSSSNAAIKATVDRLAPKITQPFLTTSPEFRKRGGLGSLFDGSSDDMSDEGRIGLLAQAIADAKSKARERGDDQ
ncbi:MAG: RNA helicase [Pseudomonadota bacterium]